MWSSVGLFLPPAIAFCVLYLVALRIRSDQTFVVLFLAGPFVAAIYLGLLVAFTDLDRGFLGWLTATPWPLLVLVAWEAGLLFGTVWRFLRQLLGIAS
jgi:hypothetical protein